MAIAKPRVFIVQENEDANLLLNGLLWLKGCESHKFIDGKECLEKINELKGKVDVVIIGGKIASDRSLTLIINIKKIKSNTDREFEEGAAGTIKGRKNDPLKEYSEKEPMTPAKIKKHEPTAVKRDPNDQTIVEEGQTGTDTQEAEEEYKRKGMTKVSDDE